MIDMHMHSINSDGTDTPLELLKKCEQLDLEYISITDHDTCKSYDDLKNINISNIFKGILIPGCELTTTYKGRTIEILGYNINPDFINDWMKNYYTNEHELSRITFSKNKCVENLEKLNIYVNISDLNKGYSYEWALLDELLKNKEENEKILGKGLLDNIRFLFRNGISNPESPLFVDITDFRPTPKQITDLIHKAGGKAFLAHPYQYAFNDILEMITDLRNECDLDGVEAFHSSFTIDQMIALQEYAKKNNLFISGGSDYHGTAKPEIKLKTGCNNLHISKNILEWIKED